MEDQANLDLEIVEGLTVLYGTMSGQFSNLVSPKASATVLDFIFAQLFFPQQRLHLEKRHTRTDRGQNDAGPIEKKAC